MHYAIASALKEAAESIVLEGLTSSIRCIEVLASDKEVFPEVS